MAVGVALPLAVVGVLVAVAVALGVAWADVEVLVAVVVALAVAVAAAYWAWAVVANLFKPRPPPASTLAVSVAATTVLRRVFMRDVSPAPTLRLAVQFPWADRRWALLRLFKGEPSSLPIAGSEASNEGESASPALSHRDLGASREALDTIAEAK